MNVATIESAGSTEHSTAINALATSQIPQPRKVLVNLTCFHCPEKMQGMDEHGKPYLHCLMLSGPVSPKTCGREYAGCSDD